MPQDSKRKRHLRRLRRDRSLAYRQVNHLLAERELSRRIIQGMANEIEKSQPMMTGGEEIPSGNNS